MKKKILLISNNFWPENFRSNDIAILLSSDYDLYVLTGYPTYPHKKVFKKKIVNDKDITKNNFHIFRIPTFKKSYSKFSTFINYLSFIILSFLIGPFLIKNKKFDYIICFASSPIYQSILTIFFSKLKKAKSIVWVQDIWPETLEDLGYIKNKYLIKFLKKSIYFLYAKHDFILTQSMEYFHHIKNEFTNTKFLFNPSDNFNSNSEVPNKIKFSVNYKYVVYSGNIGNAQNFDLLLDAAPLFKTKKIKFLFIGSGSKFNYIQDKVKKNSLDNVEVHDAISKDELSYVLKKADILFITLKKNKISRFVIPAKFQTYTSFGKPILCQTEGDVKKLVFNNNCGFIVNNEKFESMVDQLNKIINTDNNKLIEMGINSKLLYEKYFSNEVFLTSFKKIIDEI